MGQRGPLAGAPPLAPGPGGSVVVACPAGSVTGGPEALHQLVDALVDQGVAAAIAYLVPRDVPSFRESVVAVPTPEAYRGYRVPVWDGALPDDPDTVVVLPEVWSAAVAAFRRARVGLWWLSVDNNLLSGLGGYFLRPAPPSPPMHLVQSAYARAYLAAHGISTAFSLGDYLAAAHERGSEAEASGVGGFGDPRRGRRVAFNPKKGLEATLRVVQRALERDLDLEWVPIAGLDAAGVAALLARCRVYLDLGHHPGMDRLPREAALAGCAVITGRRGAAGFPEDLPIPDRFRLPDGDLDAILDRIVEAVEDPEVAAREFAPYREWIRGQRARFWSQVRELFVATPAGHVGAPRVAAEVPV